METKIAVRVGNSFNVFPATLLTGIPLKPESEKARCVEVDGEVYSLYIGETYDDSRRIDELLDKHGELFIKVHLTDNTAKQSSTASHGELTHRCPNCGSRKFTVTAHVTQDWVVDSRGDFDRALNDCVEVTHKPNDEDIWSCLYCGTSEEGKFFLTYDTGNDAPCCDSALEPSLTCGCCEKAISAGDIYYDEPGGRILCQNCIIRMDTHELLLHLGCQGHTAPAPIDSEKKRGN